MVFIIEIIICSCDIFVVCMIISLLFEVSVLSFVKLLISVVIGKKIIKLFGILYSV